jgi:hypothetical protein
MALNKEIWASDIQEMLLPDNSFLTKGTDYSAFADARTIHIPVEDGLVNVEVDRNTLPGTVGTTTEQCKEIDMHRFTTDPVRLFRPEDVELSYNKRQLVTEKIAKSLNNKIADWAQRCIGSNSGLSTEITMPQDTPSAREALLMMANLFDRGNYPEQDRYVLMDADAYATLLNDLSEAQTSAFLACADMKTGVVGQIYGLNILKRSVIYMDGTVKMVAWHKSQYSFALGPVEVYSQENAPEYYGTILSASARFGAHAGDIYFVRNRNEGNGNGDGD